MGESLPLGRMAAPDDLIGLAIFLATGEADDILAQTFDDDGENWLA